MRKKNNGTTAVESGIITNQMGKKNTRMKTNEMYKRHVKR